MGFFRKLFSENKRSERLAAWGKTVPLKALHQEVMWELWQSMQRKEIPTIDPLEKLTEDDLEYILKVCDASFRPAEVAITDPFRLNLWKELKSKGYTKNQSAILIGMRFNMVGRKDLY